jgi:hypothetical protein
VRDPKCDPFSTILDPELAKIVKAWPALHKAIRRAMAALIQ